MMDEQENLSYLLSTAVSPVVKKLNKKMYKVITGWWRWWCLFGEGTQVIQYAPVCVRGVRRFCAVLIVKDAWVQFGIQEAWGRDTQSGRKIISFCLHVLSQLHISQVWQSGEKKTRRCVARIMICHSLLVSPMRFCFKNRPPPSCWITALCSFPTQT